MIESNSSPLSSKFKTIYLILKIPTMKSFYKAILWVALWFALAFMYGCSIPSLLNPDSYGKKWENTYLFFDPLKLDTIYVSKKGMIGTAISQDNNQDYQITWTKCGQSYSLGISSYFHRFHFAYFSGYNAANMEEEIPWEQDGNTFTVTSEKLLPPEEGFYTISLSEDLTR